MVVTRLIRNKCDRLRPETKHHGKSRIHIILVTDMELTATINFYRATKSLPVPLHRLLIEPNFNQHLFNICSINQRKERQIMNDDTGKNGWQGLANLGYRIRELMKTEMKK